MAQENPLPSGNNGQPSVFLGSVLLKFWNYTTVVLSKIRQRVIQTFALFFVVFLLLWVAAFLYGSLYYSYMPNTAFSTDVYYYYRTDCESPASFWCSYPVANVSMVRNRKHVMTFGQPYHISLQLEMPESPANQAQGMFMIRTAFYSQSGGQVASSTSSASQVLSASSSRFSMLRYRTDLLKFLETLLFLPAYLSGAAEQKQMLEVELFSEYTDDPYSPSVTAVIEILSNKVQIYSSQLYVHAHFSGLRYLLFNFPLLSAFVGVSSNFIFLSIIFILSYLRLLLSMFWAPLQDRGNEMLPNGEANLNNHSHQEDEGDANAGAAEAASSLQVLPSDQSEDGPTLQSGNNAAVDVQQEAAHGSEQLPAAASN